MSSLMSSMSARKSIPRGPTVRQGLDDVQEGEQEALDLVLAQPAHGGGAAAHGGAASVQLWDKEHSS